MCNRHLHMVDSAFFFFFRSFLVFDESKPVSNTTIGTCMYKELSYLWEYRFIIIIIIIFFFNIITIITIITIIIIFFQVWWPWRLAQWARTGATTSWCPTTSTWSMSRVSMRPGPAWILPRGSSGPGGRRDVKRLLRIEPGRRG